MVTVGNDLRSVLRLARQTSPEKNAKRQVSSCERNEVRVELQAEHGDAHTKPCRAQRLPAAIRAGKHKRISNDQ